MAERRARVLAIDDAGVVAVQALAACSDCTGCAGRCNLFLDDDSGTLRLPVACFGHLPRAGDEVLLWLDDRWLTRSAWHGYGMPLAGLLLGGGVGNMLAALAQLPADLPVLAGAMLGTFCAFTLSKGSEPQIAVGGAGSFPLDSSATASDPARRPSTPQMDQIGGASAPPQAAQPQTDRELQ